ncbi:MAG TPA: hypothetical protein VEU30_13995, partial [Thermoanaerobaculia bacterium]|nr:hypothetical protein [Thermoanaerobaculia bacterium]
AGFLDAARRHGFEIVEDLDLSTMAPPTVKYFIKRLPAWRERLVNELGVTNEQVDELITNGDVYLKRYADGVYGYRLIALRNAGGTPAFRITVSARTRNRGT